jgi:replicative DNA helicase
MNDQQLAKRGMPCSIEAERSILGAVLLDNSAYAEAAESLRAEDFYLDSHRRLYRRMAELLDSGRPVDAITLGDLLEQYRETESVGGIAYMASLTDGLPRRPSIEQYCVIVKDKAMLRALIHASRVAEASALESLEPATEIVAAAEAQIYAVAQARIRESFSSVAEVVTRGFGSMDNLVEYGQRVTGLETHFTRLDEMTAGLQRKDLIIIAARPSMGKTALAMNIAENVAVLDRKVVGIFSCEMAKEALLMRMVSARAKVDAHKWRTGFLGREDRRKLLTAVGELAEAPGLYLDDTPGITLSEMRAKLRRLVQQKKQLDLVIVDYLQLMTGMRPDGRGFENRTQEVSALSRGLKSLAKEFDVPLVALSQLSRNPEDRRDPRPILSDLRESGAIEQDADVVAFIFREEMYRRDEPENEGIAELIVAKQRNGPTGTVRLAFLKQCTCFANLYEGGADGGGFAQTSARDGEAVQ